MKIKHCVLTLLSSEGECSVTGTSKALLKAFSGKGNRYLLAAAVIPLLLAMLIPMINVHVIYPAFKDVIVQSIEKDGSRLAKHEIPASLKHTELSRDKLTDVFYGQIYRLESDFGLDRIRVYAPSGEIIYSTVTAEIGTTTDQPVFYEKVAKGESVSRLREREITTIRGEDVVADMVETYVPYMRGDTFLGAIEMYYDISHWILHLDRLTTYSQAAMLTLSLTLFVSVLVLLKSVAARQQAQDRADALKEDVDRITRHDLKAPIISLSNGVRYLEGFTTLDEEQLSITTDMNKAAAMALEIINRSLDLYKMEEGTYEYSPVPMDLLSVVRRVTTDLAGFANARNVSVRMTLDSAPVMENGALPIESEEDLCYSLTANLLKNAIEASEDGDTVLVAMTGGDVIAMTIHNPTPVPEDMRDTFFEKYATAGKSGGTGLGTYSAKLLTKTLGGIITMQTSEEDGTSVTVTLHARHEPQST